MNIQLSGALGESETGGASINIVPRTGGNRYAGEFNTTYTRKTFFDRNTATLGFADALQPIESEHDVSGAYGGPILRDRLWFYSVGRDQGIHKTPGPSGQFWPNLHYGKCGWNYQPDRSQSPVQYKNTWKNVNARVTWQATQKNKINVFWDEQDFCQDPCYGVVSVFTSPESWFSVQLKPNRLQQVSWTNPLTNKILLEAGLSASTVQYDTTEHRDIVNPREIPRVIEIGNTAGGDDVAPRVNTTAGGIIRCSDVWFAEWLTDAGRPPRPQDAELPQPRVGCLRHRQPQREARIRRRLLHEQADEPVQRPADDLQLQPPAATVSPARTRSPAEHCWRRSSRTTRSTGGCRPVRRRSTYHTGPGTIQDQVMYASLYLQDQWTLKRLTISGALRYDHATSSYGSTTVGPNKFVPIQANGDNFYTHPGDVRA